MCYNDFFFHYLVQYLLKQGVVAVVGPMTSTGVKFTQPYCAGFNIPQIAPVATDPTFSFTPANFPFLVRLSPSDSIQCRALAGLISHYNWTQFALLTSKDDYGLWNKILIFNYSLCYRIYFWRFHLIMELHLTNPWLSEVKEILNSMQFHDRSIISINRLQQQDSILWFLNIT